MPDEEREAGAAARAGPDDSGPDDDGLPPSTPFDSPYFLPVMLWGFTLWFGYDAWFNPDMEYVKFNRYGFGIALGFATCSTVLAFRETPWAAVGLWAALALWFGYMAFLGEGWFTETPAAVLFNRYAFGAALAVTAYCVWMARAPTAWARVGLAAGGAAWFGYMAFLGEGWFTSAPAAEIANRVGFYALAAASVVTAALALRGGRARAGSAPPP